MVSLSVKKLALQNVMPGLKEHIGVDIFVDVSICAIYIGPHHFVAFRQPRSFKIL